MSLLGFPPRPTTLPKPKVVSIDELFGVSLVIVQTASSGVHTNNLNPYMGTVRDEIKTLIAECLNYNEIRLEGWYQTDPTSADYHKYHIDSTRINSKAIHYNILPITSGKNSQIIIFSDIFKPLGIAAMCMLSLAALFDPTLSKYTKDDIDLQTCDMITIKM